MGAGREVAEAMTYINDEARSTPGIIGTLQEPTPWDCRHELLDAMVTDGQARPA